MSKLVKTLTRHKCFLLLIIVSTTIFQSCLQNHIIGKYTMSEPVMRTCIIRAYYPNFDLNHWVILQDSVGYYYYVSQPGQYPNRLFVSSMGNHSNEAHKPISGKRQLCIGDTIQVALYKYIDYPHGFHMAERSSCDISLEDGHIIRTENGWVENIYCCPNLELINEIIYLVNQ